MGKSLTEVAKAILMNENANMATLKPNGGSAMGAEADNKKNEASLVADAPKAPGEGGNVGAAAAVKGEDKSAPKKSAVAAEPAKKLVAEEEQEDGEVVAEGTGGGKAPKPMKDADAKAIAAFKGPITKVPAKTDKKGKMKMAAEEAELNEEEDVEISEELEAFIEAMLEEGASEDEIMEAIEENFELVAEEVEEELAEEAEDAALEYDYEVDMNEHVEALFANEDLSEEFKQKAVTIFEAAVKAKMQSEIARLEEAYAAVLEEEVETIKEELSTNVDDYLNYVVEQWVSDNEVAIEAGLRTELTEEFISGLRQLFAEHYIDIPEDKVSVVEEMGSKIEELESKLNEEIERNVELSKVLSESKKNEVMFNMVEGLTATQAEKLKQLAEGVEFVDEDSFATKIKTLRENYFPTSVKAQDSLDKIEAGTEGQTMIAEEANNPMSKYVRALGKSLPK